MYCRLYLNEAFWEQISGENILLFQCDTCICSRPKIKLADFVGKYDFVGGPYGDQTRSRHQNGGFSLRSRSKMLEAIRKMKPVWEAHFTNEDIFFSDWAAQVCLRGGRALERPTWGGGGGREKGQDH